MSVESTMSVNSSVVSPACPDAGAPSRNPNPVLRHGITAQVVTPFVTAADGMLPSLSLRGPAGVATEEGTLEGWDSYPGENRAHGRRRRRLDATGDVPDNPSAAPLRFLLLRLRISHRGWRPRPDAANRAIALDCHSWSSGASRWSSRDRGCLCGCRGESKRTT